MMAQSNWTRNVSVGDRRRAVVAPKPETKIIFSLAKKKKIVSRRSEQVQPTMMPMVLWCDVRMSFFWMELGRLQLSILWTTVTALGQSNWTNQRSTLFSRLLDWFQDGTKLKSFQVRLLFFPLFAGVVFCCLLLLFLIFGYRSIVYARRVRLVLSLCCNDIGYSTTHSMLSTSPLSFLFHSSICRFCDTVSVANNSI